jgi:hypothetical protein
MKLNIVFIRGSRKVSRMARTGQGLAIHGGVVGVLLAGTSAIGLSVLSPGCGPSNEVDEGDGGENECFYAFASDFQNFTSWQHYHLDGSFEANNVHASGPRDVYINQCPPPGATEFPVGTIILKVINQPALPGQPAPTVPSVFAQVKHGCDYNSNGAPGWEWFDLITPVNGLEAGEPVQIVWSGMQAPPNSYGATGIAAQNQCNDCHSTMGEGNDSIITSALDLKDIQCKEPQP